MDYTNDELMKVLEIGIALSSEKNKNRLLDRILKEGMSISNCDAGTYASSTPCRLCRTG